MKDHKHLPPVDWKKAEAAIHDRLPDVQQRLTVWLEKYTGWGAECKFAQFPPRIVISAWIPAPPKTRRKTVGMPRKIKDAKITEENSWTWDPILLPTEDESNLIATFVGAVADEFHLQTRREGTREGGAMEYSLRPHYSDFERKEG